MNRTMIRNIGWLCVLLMWMGWTACSEEEGGGVPEPMPDENTLLESVRLRIGASGTVETRAYGGDENAVEGEFIHTLRVFIVDADNTIEKIIDANGLLDTDENALADAGNLTLFTTTVDITPGRKTIYAFANMEHAIVVGENDATTMEDILAALEEGETWNATKMEAYAIADPASDINAHLKSVATEEGVTEWQPGNDYYIPMSVRQQVDLTTNGQNVEISLVRLVSKVQASIRNRQGSEVTISKITMGTFHQNVSLFEDGTLTDAGIVTYEDTYETPITVAADMQNATALPVFYINETEKTDNQPFTISLTIDGEEMSGQTQTTSIPRNHVLPLALRLSNVDLELDITAQVAPIGGYPVQVTLADPSLTDNYHINLPEGCTFEIKGRFLPNGSDAIDASLTVELNEGEPTNIVTIEPGSSATAVAGCITALPGQQATLYFEAQTTGGLRETGYLIIHTVPLQGQDTNYPEYSGSQTRAAEWCAAPRWYEPVFLMRNEE